MLFFNKSYVNDSLPVEIVPKIRKEGIATPINELFEYSITRFIVD